MENESLLHLKAALETDSTVSTVAICQDQSWMVSVRCCSLPRGCQGVAAMICEHAEVIWGWAFLSRTPAQPRGQIQFSSLANYSVYKRTEYGEKFKRYSTCSAKKRQSSHLRSWRL